jgi:nicotinamidase-related amidase
MSFASTHGADPFSKKKITDGRGVTNEFTLWPDHCVQGSSGSKLDSKLQRSLESYQSTYGEVKLVRKVGRRPVLSAL